MKVLVTGTAGFIGFHLARGLLKLGHQVVGIDNINDYYDVGLKYARLEQMGIRKQEVSGDRHSAVNSQRSIDSYQLPNYSFYKADLQDRDYIMSIFDKGGFDRVVHLAAQAGVRYSLDNPYAYIDSNISGFINILEGCRHHKIKHLVYASSSSVYGLNETMPFSTHNNVDHPVSLYAATKKSNELMAHTYSHLFGLPTTGLRFFTVYGPWGRPDMALFLFTKAILEGKPIDVYNNGDMQRDFTYIDDIVKGIARVMERAPAGDPSWAAMTPDPSSSKAPYKIYNIGNNHPVQLMDFIAVLEETLGKQALKNYLPLQPGDVKATYADVSGLAEDFGYKPSTSIREGVRLFVKWYLNYYD